LRLPGNLNMSFAGVDGEAVLLDLKEVALSSGSACTSANPEPSHVLRALGIGEEATRSSVRFGLGRFNTSEEVDFVVARLAEIIARLRKLGNGETLSSVP
jgi:cysteine desulfurase